MFRKMRLRFNRLELGAVELKAIVEALLMSQGEPLSIDAILSAFEDGERPTRYQVQAALDALAADCEARSVELKQLASGYCFQTKQCYRSWVVRLKTEKPIKYTPQFLEVLAIIAYKQPVTRADIEDIRGVSVSSAMLKTLLERDWIQVAGYKDVPGKPTLYTTTKTFLDYFNLKGLQDLPSIDNMQESTDRNF